MSGAPTTTTEQAGALLPSVDLDLERAKQCRRELRDELVVAEAEVTRLADLRRSILALVNSTAPESAGHGLVGWRVGHRAAAILRERGPLHYRQVWQAMYEEGARIDSDEPEAVVLTALTRHPEVVRARRGVYETRDEDEQ